SGQGVGRRGEPGTADLARGGAATLRRAIQPTGGVLSRRHAAGGDELGRVEQPLGGGSRRAAPGPANLVGEPATGGRRPGVHLAPGGGGALSEAPQRPRRPVPPLPPPPGSAVRPVAGEERGFAGSAAQRAGSRQTVVLGRLDRSAS